MKQCVIAFLLLVPSVTIALTLVGFIPWSKLNCWEYAVDIQSGRIRYTRYLFYATISQSVKDSSLTKLLRPETLNSPPEWRIALTFSPNVRHSPHYAYHGAMNQIEELERIFRLDDFSPDAKRAIGEKLLNLWQTNINDKKVNRYLNTITKLMAARHEQEQTQRIEIRDLPSEADF